MKLAPKGVAFSCPFVLLLANNDLSQCVQFMTGIDPYLNPKYIQ